MGEKIYNNIELPDVWPPRTVDLECSEPQRIPYLEKRPDVVDIDIGRQLFVDDFLIQKYGTEMTRKYHHPDKYTGNPIFFPQSPEELNDDLPPCTIPKSGGVWFDTADQTFKMWYMASYLGNVAYATSRDGINWERPSLDIVPGTNLCMRKELHPDSGSVVIDYETTNPDERFKYLLREPNPLGGGGNIPAHMLTSPDGIHWTEKGMTGIIGDRSTMHYNPFRKKWVQSIRWCEFDGRDRHYQESDDFVLSGKWDDMKNVTPWMRADSLDHGDGNYPQLYNHDAIAYESLMLNFHEVHKGPPNHVGEGLGLPKLTEITLGTSRDGFHIHRPDRTPFIGARREPGSWEYGYVESSAGMCLVVGDELWFYYTAYAGDPNRANTDSWYVNGTYANGAMGLAKLRRDGFASMQARYPGATLRTRPVRFSGSHFFVNVQTASSNLRVEVQDQEYTTIEGFSYDDCLPFNGNSTSTEIRWKHANLSQLAGKPVRFVFKMDRGEIYSFWVSKSEKGESNGYIGAGGPGFTGPIDTIGK